MATANKIRKMLKKIYSYFKKVIAPSSMSLEIFLISSRQNSASDMLPLETRGASWSSGAF